ncbi:TonB-dependent siderophore receptor [Vibrio coralliilyticus]|uniref:TonB-dependent siderophore receptor n=1 Tax=Vibrio coralliilyticus TaxID=190893 RepID=UPI0016B0211D|nr:TonB-dependent siderophore receptor [Vibrio coralliilyticus]NOI29386.1 TonB-dependent siderophore receptor [Vibrio coralliilyticus]NOI48350.1 TonB-dependent siderophore receptor [Vibrio coralliilyticus]
MNRQFMLSPACLAVAFALSAGVVNAAEDETVVVVGQEHDSAVGPDFSYLGQKSRTATKTDLAIHETPRAVSVVTREQMDDRASISIADALKYTPSIQSNYFGEDNKQDWFVVRGFDQAGTGLYQDGTRLYSAGFYSWQIDPNALERVEILRGPASVLYGQNPPGGLINLVSKRPQFDGGSGQVAVEYGSYDRLQLTLDVNREVSEDVAFRIVAMGRKNGTQVDNVEAERIMVAPSLAWNINDSSSITFLTSYQKDDSDPYLQFLPMEGTLTSNPNGTISDSVAIGNPDWETFEREQLSLGYEFEHQFSDSLSFGQSVRYSQMDLNLRQITAGSYVADTGFQGTLDPSSSRETIVRFATVEQGESDAFNIDNRIVYEFKTGSVEHTLLAGVDYQQIDIDSKAHDSDTIVGDGNNPVTLLGGLANPSFNVFNPSYTNNIVLLDPSPGPLPTTLTDADMKTIVTKNRQLGLYLQDQLKIADKWLVQVGARYDDTSNEQNNETTGNNTKAEYEEWTTNVGFAYLTDFGLTPYISYAQSFEPKIRTDVSTQPVKPERGEAYEAGLKYQPRGFDGYFNVAVYQASKKDVVQTSNNQVVQIGEIQNRGAEFGAVANVTESLTLVGNVAYVDSEIKADTDQSIVGNRPQQVADLLASAWAKYQVFGGTFDGVSVGGGVRYVSDTYGDNKEQNKVPSFTLYDATVSYRFDDYKFQVAAKNIFDKEYISTCYSSSTCFYGDRRNVIASVSYDW